MEWVKQSHQKSLIGQLLVDKKLITEQQLAEAIDYQQTSGQRLGDIFAEWNLVTRRQIQSMLRKQRNLRLAATVATALLAPLQVYAASTAPVPVVQSQSSSASQKSSGMRELTEAELSDIAGQGILDDTLSNWLNLNQTANNSILANQNMASGLTSMLNKQTSGLQVLGDLATLMDPFLLLLGAQTTVNNVTYDAANAAAVVNKDGSITLSMPSSIGELSFQNIRVMGSSGPSFGNVDIKGINLSGTTVTLKAH